MSIGIGINPLWPLLVGLLIGWLIEWVIDWVYWRRRRQDRAASLHGLAETRRATDAELQTARARLAERTQQLEQSRAKLDSAHAEAQGMRDELASAREELERANQSLQTADTSTLHQEVELGSLRASLAELRQENERLRGQVASTTQPTLSAPLQQEPAEPDEGAEVETGGPATASTGLPRDVAALAPLPAGSDAAPVEVEALDTAPELARNPLIDINGVGPVYEQRLIAAGVYTFEQLAGLTPARILEIIRPEAWQRIDAEAWIAEARLLAQQVREGTYQQGEH